MRHFSNRSWKNIQKEAKKCVLLCHNCHMEEHYPNLTIANLGNIEDYIPPVKCPPNFCKCGKQIYRDAKTCKSCVLRKTEINWPPVDKLKQMLAESNYSALGRKLGVSDNAIRKHLQRNS